MDDVEALKALEERENNLHFGIENITRDINGAQAALVRGDPPGRLVDFIQDRQASLNDHLVQLGRTEQKIEDLKARVQERVAASGKDWFRRSAPEAHHTPLDAKQRDERDWFRRDPGTEQQGGPDAQRSRRDRERF